MFLYLLDKWIKKFNMKKHNIVLLVLILFIGYGCNQGKVRKKLLPAVSGTAGEVIVVMDRDPWLGQPGETVRSILAQDVPCLPQSEPMFNLVNISHKAFSELFRIHRNIVMCNISSSVVDPVISVENDKWAQPQTVININVPNRDVFIRFLNENSDKLIGILLKAERDRLTDNYRNYGEQDIISKLENKVGIHLGVPKGYQYALDTNNFIWLSYETPQISQGVFVYYYDYKDTSMFSRLSLINKRNEILQKYVAGPREGSYMTTELQIMPEYRTYEYKGIYTGELRGLWKVEGDYMGGPFVSITRFDKERNRLITVEGFVYAPKYDKRNYLRQVEAILYSLELIPEGEMQKIKKKDKEDSK